MNLHVGCFQEGCFWSTFLCFSHVIFDYDHRDYQKKVTSIFLGRNYLVLELHAASEFFRSSVCCVWQVATNYSFPPPPRRRSSCFCRRRVKLCPLFAVANGVGRNFFKSPKVFGAAKSITLKKYCLTYLPLLNFIFPQMQKRGEISLFGFHFSLSPFRPFFAQEKKRDCAALTYEQRVKLCRKVGWIRDIFVLLPRKLCQEIRKNTSDSPNPTSGTLFFSA